jgi:tetratricopeptide (TPR) repeat protein
MKTAALLILGLGACAPSLTPEEASEQEYREAVETRDNGRALALLDRAIARRPKADYLVMRAMLHQSLKEPDAALADYSAAIALRRDEPSAEIPRATLHLNRALLHADAGRFTEAEVDFGEALRLVPEFVEALLHRARIRRRAGRGDEADRDTAEARRIGSAFAEGFYNEGVRAITQGNSAEAERMFAFSLELDPDFGRAHVAMARIHMERRRFPEAARELDLALKVHPAEAELYYHRGTAHLAAGQGEEALADYAKAVELDPRQAPYFAARGLAWQRVRHDAGKATADLDEAIRLEPDCYSAWFNRGVTRHEAKDLEAAERDLRKAVSIRASPEGTLALGRVLHDRGDYDRALSLYRDALGFYKDAEAQKALREELERTRLAKENRK